jgi:glycosyltransferase involved in cell wall biosynthesis
MVVNEAMASGCVVCGTRVGLVADLENEATLAVNVQDADALADKVLMLLSNDELYKNLQQKGRAWSLEHDIIWCSKQYENLYEQLIDSSHRFR